MKRPAAILFGVVLAASTAGAVQLALDRRAIEEALYIGQSRIDLERTRFHVPYRVKVASPPVDWIDVITPFHRVELAAESAARTGRRLFGQREALAVLAEAPSQIDLLVEMTFHPLNTFVGVPSYEVAIVKRTGERILPRRLDRLPRFGPRGESSTPSLPTDGTQILGGGQPILGGTLVVAFDGSKLDTSGRQQILVLDGKAELARATLDLSGMR